MKVVRYVERKWHDEDLRITAWGLCMMRTMITVGALLGSLIGCFITSFIYEILP